MPHHGAGHGGEELLIFPAFVPVQVREIADVRVLPLLLGGFLVLLGVGAVGHTLVVTVGAHTHDVAVLRAQTEIMPLRYEPPGGDIGAGARRAVVVLVAAGLAAPTARRVTRLRVGDVLRTE